MCSKAIHDYLKNELSTCPFCNSIIKDIKTQEIQCCDNPNIINDTKIVCQNCGTVHGYQQAQEYINFYKYIFLE